jgi:glycosyltransferase involved in cell wall biosynthesis
MSFVSVIIPTRNRATLLRQTIRSVLDQTWSETEIIVVDEASEDNTLAVLDEFGDHIDLVQHESPKGPSAARNVGVDKSSGEYVLFLDDDDLLHPRHVEELVRFSEELPSRRIAASGWCRFQVKKGNVEVGSVMRPPETWRGVEAIRAIFGHEPGCLVWGPSVLWPVEVFEEERWERQLFNNEDVDFYSRVLLAGYQFAGTEAGMAYYRSHAGASMSETQSTQSVISSVRCRLKHSRLLQNHPQREEIAPAMRDSLMRMLIKLRVHGGLAEWVDQIKNAYARWGGSTYYLPQPPQNWFKRHLLETSLSVGGPKTVGLLLRFQSKLSEAIDYEPSSNVETIDYEFLMRQLVNAKSASVTPSK